MILKSLVLFVLIISLVRCVTIFSLDGKSKLELNHLANNGLLFELSFGNETKLNGNIGRKLNLSRAICSNNECSLYGNDSFLSVTALNSSFEVSWTYDDYISENMTFTDCLNLNSSSLSWFGGPETLNTQWPIEKLTLQNRPYISSKLDNGALIESYWLNSRGGFILVNKSVPLFVDQNNEVKDTVCFKAISKLPYQNKRTFLKYVLVARKDPREAHLYAINTLLSKPRALPNTKMVSEPIWTTWGKYKADINDSTVLDFMTEIYFHNFTKGQIEIDDKWEACYGDQTFDKRTTKFSKINETIQKIHNYGFRATLWTHPFVNTECLAPIREGVRNGYFVNSSTGHANTSWWNGDSAYVIDFTNKNASNWFKERLLLIHEKHGIDGFKCDAGENDWLPPKPVFHVNYSDAPNAFTRLYLETCSQLGNLIEARCGFRTQNLQIFIRMLDKNSVWGNNNGLRSIVHAILQFNMIGYTFVLPDLVGGNGYNGVEPSAELLVRWTQANTFMPAIQFSYLPWELKSVSFNTTDIVRKFVNLREEYSDVILSAMRNSSIYGVPVNPPIWWVDPTDSVAHKVEDEFLVGEKILVAPVLKKGAISRRIYLPKGIWQDGNHHNIIYNGGIFLNYTAPIDVLPYFLRL